MLAIFHAGLLTLIKAFTHAAGVSSVSWCFYPAVSLFKRKYSAATPAGVRTDPFLTKCQSHLDA